MSSKEIYGLPENILQQIFEDKSIQTFYEWQESCLEEMERNGDKNFIYTAPTSGGKTLVAEVAMLKELLVKKRNVIMMLPYVAMIHEKVQSLSASALALGYCVEEYAGLKGKFPPIKRRNKRSLYISTIEKALVLVNSFIAEKRITEIGLVIVDELHLIGESSRGALLENMLMKLLLVNVRIIAMSATIGNLEDLGSFLKAHIYTANFRPTALTEHVIIDDELFKIDYGKENIFTFERQIGQMNIKTFNIVGHLVKEVIPKKSCLVFCPTKRNCENVVKTICTDMLSIESELSLVQNQQKQALIEALTAEGNGNICPILKNSIHFGIAYHHSGLTSAERKLIEEGFLSGTICCICCTSTLAVGVNLPAQRVIIRSPFIACDFLTFSKYKQMSGRAGRTGFAEVGECFIVCLHKHAFQLSKMFVDGLDVISSQMRIPELTDLILSLLHLQLIKTETDILEIIKLSFLLTTSHFDEEDVDDVIHDIFEDLQKYEAIKIVDGEIVLLQYGVAIAEANLPLDITNKVYADLKRARNHLVLVDELHLLYLLIPPNVVESVVIPYQVLVIMFNEITPDALMTAKAVGINDFSIQELLGGKAPKILTVTDLIWSLETLTHFLHFSVILATIFKRQIQTLEIFVISWILKNVDLLSFFALYSLEERQLTTRRKTGSNENQVKRFFLARILFKLTKGEDHWKVANEYELDRGILHSFLSSTSSFTSAVLRFCEVIEELWCFKLLFAPYPEKLSCCYSVELLPLMELPAVKMGRAKLLYNAGYTTIASIANADPKKLVEQISYLSSKQAHQIVNVAKLTILTQAELLHEEAEATLTLLS